MRYRRTQNEFAIVHKKGLVMSSIVSVSELLMDDKVMPVNGVGKEWTVTDLHYDGDTVRTVTLWDGHREHLSRHKTFILVSRVD